MRLLEVGTKTRRLILCGDARKYVRRKGGTFVGGIFWENINKTKHVAMAMARDQIF